MLAIGKLINRLIRERLTAIYHQDQQQSFSGILDVKYVRERLGATGIQQSSQERPGLVATTRATRV